MKSLNDTIDKAVEVFCENARTIANRKSYYEKCGCDELVQDIILIESQLQEIDDMIQEFEELKSLGLYPKK
jgi:hypothetical protein